MSRSLRLVGFIATLAATASSAQEAPDPLAELSPDETSLLLNKLSEVKKAFEKTREEVLDAAEERFAAASASESAAADLYIAAWKIINRDRRVVGPDEDPPDPYDEEWKEELLEWMGRTGAPRALRLQLGWLALTIKASKMEEDDRVQLMPEMQELAKQATGLVQLINTVEDASGSRVVATVGGGGPRRGRGEMTEEERNMRELRRILTQGPTGTLFAQAYNLNSYLKNPERWPKGPLDLAGIYGNWLLPHARVESKGSLPDLWDEWIRYEATEKQGSLDDGAYIMWAAVQGKDLTWKKNMDMAIHGVRIGESVSTLVDMIEDNPNHPSLGKWASDLETVQSALLGESELVE